MSYRINSTGRKKLLREFISIKLGADVGGVPTFSAEISIPKDMALPQSAKVYVEPYVKSSTMRFSFGTVGCIESPFVCVMTDIDAGASVLFRVKIVDESSGHGRILAAANGIRPDSDSAGNLKKSLLPVRSLDLGQILWRLDIHGEGGPELQLNNKVAGVLERIKTEIFWQAAVYPEVVRQVACFVFLNSEELTEDSEWCKDWVIFFERLLGREIDQAESSDRSEAEELVAQIVERFAVRQGYIDRIVGSEL